MNDRGEVTERLKVLASKASVRETVPWVRIPPSPPFFLFCSQSVRTAAFFVYLWRPLRFEERNRIVCPSALHICLCLLLPLSHPRRIVLLRDLYASVAQKNQDAF